MRDKIKNLLLVCREEIKDKWWNRLFHVFLYVTTAVVLVGSFVFYYEGNRGSNFAADNSEKKILSFQLDGELLSESGSSGYMVDCFLKPDTKFRITNHEVIDNSFPDEFPFETEPMQVLSGFCGLKDNISIEKDNCWLFCMNDLIDTLLIQNGYVAEDSDFFSIKKVRDQRSEGEWLLHFYELGQLDDLKAQIWPTDMVNFLVISSLVLGAFATAIGWFVLWESMIYRCLLYIVYGKTNKQPNPQQHQHEK